MSNEGKIMTCIIGDNIRSIIKQANELKIQREDIVGITTLGEQLYLIYYR